MWSERIARSPGTSIDLKSRPTSSGTGIAIIAITIHYSTDQEPALDRHLVHPSAFLQVDRDFDLRNQCLEYVIKQHVMKPSQYPYAGSEYLLVMLVECFADQKEQKTHKKHAQYSFLNQEIKKESRSIKRE